MSCTPGLTSCTYYEGGKPKTGCCAEGVCVHNACARKEGSFYMKIMCAVDTPGQCLAVCKSKFETLLHKIMVTTGPEFSLCPYFYLRN